MKCAMRPDLTKACKAACHAFPRSPDGLRGLEIGPFVVEAPPQPFHKHILPPPSRPIHTQLNPVIFQKPDEFLACELAALIGIKDVRCALPGNRLLYDFHAEFVVTVLASVVLHKFLDIS